MRKKSRASWGDFNENSFNLSPAIEFVWEGEGGK